MTQFRKFLRNTHGHHLLEFWIDSETFKDCLEDLDEEDTLVMRNQLFRYEFCVIHSTILCILCV